MTAPRPAVSDAAERMYAALRAYQPGDADNGWLLLHLCEARARMGAKTRAMLQHDELGSGRRRAHDPDRAPDFYLPRLRDLVGNDDEGLTGAALRTGIRDRPRARRCTIDALRSSVLRTLSDDATADDVRVVERFGDTPAYGLAVLCRSRHVLDATASYRAARKHKPLFVKLTFSIDDRVLIGEGTMPLGDVDPAVTIGNAQIGQV